MTDPTEVRLLAERQDGVNAQVGYVIKGWTVWLQSLLANPYDGPDELRVALTEVEDMAAAVETDGLTVEVLRLIPMADARRRITRLKREHRAHGTAAAVQPSRGRLETAEDWSAFARLYVEVVSAGYQKPIRHLEAITGLGRNTLSARVRKARERGYLTGPPGKPATALGPAALGEEKTDGND